MGQQLNIMQFKLNQPALIEASAGTGKTYTITNLVLRILLGSGDRTNSLDRPLLLDDLLIVTFTNVATADLKRRIYERIRTAHVLFENFLELATQELLLKAQSLLKQEFKGKQEGTQEWEELLSSLGLSSTEFSMQQLDSTEFCRQFLQEESLAPKLSQKLKQYEVNIERLVKEKLNCHDDFLIQLLKQMAVQNTIHDAICVLTQAERSIDNAAICTIHSFCNRTLNQIYAFEANEAFVTELTVDLDEEDRLAANSVWRQQFYRLASSPAVLRLLEISSPKALSALRTRLNSVRLSQDNTGVFGYQLQNFHIPGMSQTVDLTQEFTVNSLIDSLFFRIEVIDGVLGCLQLLAFMDWKKIIDLNVLAGYIDLENGRQGSKAITKGKVVEFVSNGANFVQGLTLFEQVYQKISSDASLLDSLQKMSELVANNKAEVASPEERIFLTQLKSFNLSERLGELNDVLRDAASKLVLSAFDVETKFLYRASNSLVKSDEYLQLHDTFIALVKQVRSINKLTSVFKHTLWTLLSIQINQQLRQNCQEHHIMSNDDLLLNLDQALQREDIGGRLAQLIRKRYPVAMIDEFQDTDPIQYSIFSRIYLNKEALKEKAYCYLIGDPKQSIYAFRGSDINSYLKARNTIKQLTNNQGLCTLGVNYRSTEDVISAYNAMFSNTLYEENVCPFKERDIQFKPVGINKKLLTKPELPEGMSVEQFCNLPVDSVAMARAWGSNFVIEHLQDSNLLVNAVPNFAPNAEAGDVAQSADAAKNADGVDVAQNADVVQASNTSEVSQAAKADDAQASQETERLVIDPPFKLPHCLSNTYVVDMCTESYKKVDDLRAAYADATALLIKKILTDGKFVSKNSERPVKPSDIAILVRSANENNFVQSSLQRLGLSSVYFSDNSSVLFNPPDKYKDQSQTPTTESLDLLYLMEAMCDYANRSKVMRVLGSGLLRLHTSEFLEHIKDQNFEKEVMILRACADTWLKNGFLPAFTQWCDAPEHQVVARLLSIINGERILTNYTQISELIQAAHNRYSGIQAQLRWFYDTLYSEQQSFDSDSTQKRLESEHEQIKVLTVHKSKGLEFELVFMPFLWVQRNSSNSRNGVELPPKYYSPDVNHMVLDYNNDQKIRVPNEVKIALDRIKFKKEQALAKEQQQLEATNEAVAVAESVANETASEASDKVAHETIDSASAAVKEGTAPATSAPATKGKKSASKSKRSSKVVVADNVLLAPLLEGLKEGEVTNENTVSSFIVDPDKNVAHADSKADNVGNIEAVTAPSAKVANVQTANVKDTGKDSNAKADGSKDADSKAEQSNYFEFTPRQLSDYEEAKEQTRLLYVAVTRARSANFFFVGDFSGRQAKSSALMELFGIESTNDAYAQFNELIRPHTDLFTIIDGAQCCNMYEAELEFRHANAPLLSLSSNAPHNVEQGKKLQQEIDRLLDQAIVQGRELMATGKWHKHLENGETFVFYNAPFVMIGDIPLERTLLNKINELRQEILLTQVNNTPVQLEPQTKKLPPNFFSNIQSKDSKANGVNGANEASQTGDIGSNNKQVAAQKSVAAKEFAQEGSKTSTLETAESALPETSVNTKANKQAQSQELPKVQSPEQSQVQSQTQAQTQAQDNSAATKLTSLLSLPQESESCAMSFMYKGAIDQSFNIMSYSRLTHGQDPVKLALEGQNHVAKRNENEDGAVDITGTSIHDPWLLNMNDLSGEQESSVWVGQVNETGLGTLVGGNLCTYHQEIEKAREEVKVLEKLRDNPKLFDITDTVRFTQTYWDAGYFWEDTTPKQRQSNFNFDFAKGAEAGTFMHELLRLVDFGQMQNPDTELNVFLSTDLKQEIYFRLDMLPMYHKSKLYDRFGMVTDWLIDILEAPIIQGTHQCLALSDLQKLSFEHEMEFLMTSSRFNTQDIDQICQEMALKMLPQSKHSIIPNLVLTQEEAFGFITGSLDVACRFDLDFEGDLKYRYNLMSNWNHKTREYFEMRCQQMGYKMGSKVNPEPNYKYYVIDYKTNVLGDKYEDYSTNNMLMAIYKHRYDVQFLFYTVALYRLLKRRMGILPTADYEELEQFYNDNIGGVIYMYLRGLRADFTRSKISTGVFSAKIDFEYVYRLDQVFGAEQL